MSAFSAVLIGHESLTLQCGQMLLDAGHVIRAVVSRQSDVRDWAASCTIPVVEPGPGLVTRLGDTTFDWLFSVANLDMLPAAVLALPSKGAINFHDGPLSRYAGLNAPVWAILNAEPTHGITWHLMTDRADEGDILDQRLFDLARAETALTLNTKCYAAALDSFPDLLAQLADDRLVRQPQDLTQRTYFSRGQRPAHGGMIDVADRAEDISALVRALDHGHYRNPLTAAKLEVGGQLVVVGGAECVGGTGAPGTVVTVSPDALTIAVGDGLIRLTGLRDLSGKPVSPVGLVRTGDRLASPAPGLDHALAATVRDEPYWRGTLETLVPVVVPSLGGALGSGPLTHELPLSEGVTGADMLAHLAQMVLDMAGMEFADIAVIRANVVPGIVSDWVPVRIARTDMSHNVAAALDDVKARKPFAADLPLRLAGPVPAMPKIAFSEVENGRLHQDSTLTLVVQSGVAQLHADPKAVSPQSFSLIVARLMTRLTGDTRLPRSERDLILGTWNATDAPYAQTCIHHLIEAQVRRTPEAQAVVFGGETLTYAQLNTRANAVAQRLQSLGVKPGTLVGLYVRRSASLMVGALAILKAGGAYVPMDPAYPADRTALYIEDSGAPVIVTEAALTAGLPPHTAQVLVIDADPGPPLPDNIDSGVTPADLAYLIYTSGSTGRPKGVMIEHRNVANFFAGMDACIPHDPPGTWLAVTSLSFDISVLELFWTLTHGFKVVISSDDNRRLMTSSPAATGRGMEFSLFYWGNDDGVGRDKYRLLLDGAKFADAHGFTAVWTPERHFHAFGGPYPNPSVTGAAVAAVTQNLSVRGGSCVAPLHHPARIAEEWAVIDNLTNGRAGIAIASGWQPDDFVLRPENTPPHNKPAMFDAITKLRALWRGEAVEFPTASGAMFSVVTQPRPVSKTLPIWVTTAGNPETWREAGSIGANVLTHLLGQSVAEVGEKIVLYHNALRAAGHDPADHKVTLMLHTYLADSRDKAREVAREPMKDYLRSAAALIKQYAWAFPAFKKPVGVTNAMQIDLGSLEPEEMEGILDFAFMRYFDESGLFGTVEDAIERVESLKKIDVDEIACLIDYGIAVDTVLEGLKPLADVLARTNQPTDDLSLADSILRHGVTHLQCTPSMARMLVTHDDTRATLRSIKHLMIGGEALPGALVSDLQKASGATITNMYGPTETTVWSTAQTATAGDGVTGIGRPIANTQVYVLDDDMQPVPVGIAGELYIGGDGVARGYWQRPDLTTERFLPDPFRTTVKAGNRIYRTGDLVRWTADGSLDFLGRADHQVKLRGYRIELGEIEAAVDAFAGVRQSVVMAREDVPGSVQLVAYYTAGGPVDDGAFKAALAQKLPDHMIPVRFIRLDAMPLTPNKKVDRKALPVPMDRAAVAEVSAPVQAGSQAAIAAIWARILGVQNIAARDSFFDLGGHSLLAVQAHRDIRDTLGAAKLSITDIFRFPTLAALAARVDELTLPAPVVVAPITDDRAAARTDAMSRRRDLRARRTGQG